MDNPTSSVYLGASKKKIPGIYDGEYFQVLLQDNDMLIVRCNSCPPSLQLRTSIKSNGNIIKHIQRRHPELLNKIRIEKNIKCRRTSRVNGPVETSNQNSKDGKYSHTESGQLQSFEIAHESEYNNHRISERDCDYQDGTITNEKTTYFNDLKTEHCDQENLLLHNERVTHSNHNSNDILDDETGAAHTETHYLVDNDDMDEMNASSADDDKVKYWTSDKLNPNLSEDVIALQKELMVREFEDIQDMRRQKHRLEIEILRQDLEFKKIEHRKKIELLDKRLKH